MMSAFSALQLIVIIRYSEAGLVVQNTEVTQSKQHKVMITDLGCQLFSVSRGM